MKTFYCFFALVFLFCTPAHATPTAPSWAVYYGSAEQPQKFKNFDVVVFDAETHPALQPLLYRGKDLLGYISGGEAEDYRPNFQELKERGLLLVENPDWKGHFVIDIRKPEWAQYVIEEAIPRILRKGFNGIMIDTLDSPLALEAKDPKTYAGMKEAATHLVRAIRYHYPNLVIMVNRGFEILPQVGGDINYLLAESVRVKYDSKTKAFSYFPDEVYQYHVNLFHEAQKANPHLKIVTLDYWDVKDKKGVKALYNVQRKNGFIPYVATMDLQSLCTEPE